MTRPIAPRCGPSICVDTFKKIHFFLPGVLDGPRIPEGYCKAGGLPNTHHYGGAADVRLVDGKPLKGNATDPDVLEAGELLACLSPMRRPDQIIGPPGWFEALGYGREEGWVMAPDQLRLHKDHPHRLHGRARHPKPTMDTKPIVIGVDYR